MLLFGALFFAFPVLAASPSSGVLNERSNLRESAGYTKILSVLNKSTKVDIIGESGDWYQVSLKDGVKGWIIKWLIDLAPQKVSEQKTATLAYASRIRKTPEIAKDNIIETLFPGTVVKITGTKEKWYSIDYQSNKKGWIAQELIGTVTTDQTAHRATATAKEMPAATSTYPKFVTEAEINQYWQKSINALRKAKGLRELMIDSRFIQTAEIWASYNGKINQATHTRPNGGTAQDWINDQELTFTKRNSDGGWKTNYFVENLGVRLNVKPTLAGVKTALDAVLNSFLSEGPTGVHYRTVYHPDWNCFGAGWYPIKNSNGTYAIYFVFHYGSLAR